MDTGRPRMNDAHWLDSASVQVTLCDGLKSPNSCCIPPATPDSTFPEGFPANLSPPQAPVVFSGDWRATLSSSQAGATDRFGTANEAYPYPIAAPAVDHFLPAVTYGFPPAYVQNGQFLQIGGNPFLHHQQNQAQILSAGQQQLSGAGIQIMQQPLLFSGPAFSHWPQPSQQHQPTYGEVSASISGMPFAAMEAPVRISDRDGTAYAPGFQPSVFQPMVSAAECSFPSAAASAWSPATEDSIAMAATPASAPVLPSGEQPVVDEPVRRRSEPFAAFPAEDRGFSATRAFKGPEEAAENLAKRFSPWIDPRPHFLSGTHQPTMLATPVLETSQSLHHDGTVSPADLHITPPYMGQGEPVDENGESPAFVAREKSSCSSRSSSVSRATGKSSARDSRSSPGVVEAQPAERSDSPPAPQRVPLPRPLTPTFFAEEAGDSPSSRAEELMAAEDSDVGPVTAQPSLHTTGTPARPYVVGFPPPPTTRDEQDALLVQLRQAGHTYKEIKAIGRFDEAESTLRGRFRTLTKRKEERVRRPRWTDDDDRLLVAAVHQLVRGGWPPQDPAAVMRISWKAVADFIAEHGGSYRFGNTTCHKRWTLLQRQRRL